MRNLGVMLRKELRYQWRGYRILIVAAIFFLFGLGTPLLFNYIDVLVPQSEQELLPEFTTQDVVNEYLDTVGQIGMVAAILLAMGLVAGERSSGTAAMTLSKPVGVGAFLSAKLIATAVTFAIGLVLGAVGCYLYTLVLFDDPGAVNFLVANLVAALFLLFALALTLMFSSFFKNQLAAGGLALVVLVVLSLTAGLTVMDQVSPGALMGAARSLAAGEAVEKWGPLVATPFLTGLVMVVAWQVFRRREI